MKVKLPGRSFQRISRPPQLGAPQTVSASLPAQTFFVHWLLCAAAVAVALIAIPGIVTRSLGAGLLTCIALGLVNTLIPVLRGVMMSRESMITDAVSLLLVNAVTLSFMSRYGIAVAIISSDAHLSTTVALTLMAWIINFVYATRYASS